MSPSAPLLRSQASCALGIRKATTAESMPSNV